MNLESLRPLANHLWQSTLFVALAGFLTLALRRNRARVRHGVWLAASCKFLIPLSALIALGGHMAWLRPATALSSPWVSPPGGFAVMNEASQPFTASTADAPVVRTAPGVHATVPRDSFPAVLVGLWACGFAGIAVSWFVRWRGILAAVRAGSPMNLALPIRAISSSALLEPAVFGIFRPTLLLPDGVVEHLAPAQLKAVIAHELCHVRHRDNLAAAFQMFVETVFWFHPAVWWIGKRMVTERERACDEEVLQLGMLPQVYAEGILSVCRMCVESPLACVPGVTGSLGKRIHRIVSGRAVHDLTLARRATLAVAGAACLAAPILIGVWSSSPLRGERETPVELPAVTFREVRIERCKGYRFGEIVSPAPGRLAANCVTAVSLIYMAYTKSAVRFSGDAQPIPLSGDPGWLGSGNYLYRLDASAVGGASLETMEGPMLQSLLADRFALKIRRVTRTVPMYALKVAKGGAKLQAAKEAGCSGGGVWGAPPPPPGGRKNCMRAIVGPEPYSMLDAEGSSLAEFCRLLAGRLGKPVVDKTGIPGSYGFHLKFANQRTPASLSPLYPPLSDVLKAQLGLELEPITGPRDFLVIDRVEKPLPE